MPLDPAITKEVLFDCGEVWITDNEPRGTVCHVEREPAAWSDGRHE